MDSDKLDFLQEIDKLVEEETGGTCRIYNQDVLFENPPGISYERFLNMDLGLSNKPFISQLKVLFTNLANADTTSKPHVNDILKAVIIHHLVSFDLIIYISPVYSRYSHMFPPCHAILSRTYSGCWSLQQCSFC